MEIYQEFQPIERARDLTNTQELSGILTGVRDQGSVLTKKPT